MRGRILANLVCILISWTCLSSGQELFDLLAEFRGSMSHRPGVGTFQHPAMTLMSGGGSSSELCEAFHALALEHGYEVRLLSGVVSMSGAQASDWLGDASPFSLSDCILGRDGRWNVSQGWVRCRAGYGLECVGLEGDGGRWIDVFPSLVGGEVLHGSWQRVSRGEVKSLCEGVATVSLSTEESRLLGTGPWHRGVSSALSAALEHQEKGDSTAVGLGSGPGVRGYRSSQVQSLRPVAILSCADAAGLSEPTVGIQVCGAGGVLLRCERPLSDYPTGLIELGWGASEARMGLVSDSGGGQVFGQRPVCWISGHGGRVEGLSALYGCEVTVTLTFSWNGKNVTRLTDSSVVGEHVVYVFSRGGYAHVEGDCECQSSCLHRLAGELRERQELFLGLSRALLNGRSRVGVSRVGLRPYGTRRLGALYHREGFCLVAGSHEGLSGDGTMDLVGELGSSLVASDYFRECGMGNAEGALDCWDMALGRDEVLVAEESSFRCIQGEHSACMLTQDVSDHGYGGGWQSLRGGWLDTGTVCLPLQGVVGESGLQVENTGADWCTVLSLLASFREFAVNGGMDLSCAELPVLSVFAGYHSRQASLGSLQSLSWVQEQAGDTGGSGCRISFACAGVEHWSLRITDETGDTVHRVEGSGQAAELWWDGRDLSGGTCPEGAYRVQLSLQNAHGTSRYVRVVGWDVTAPELRLLCHVSGEGASRQLECEYAVSDRHGVACDLTISSLSGGHVYVSERLSDLSGTYAWEVDGEVSETCRVELRARDAFGNEGFIRQHPVLGQAYVGGEVWGPEGSSDGVWNGRFRGRITFPRDGSVVKSGLLEVRGELTVPSGQLVKYQLRLRDSRGRLLACGDDGVEDGVRQLSYYRPSLSEEMLEISHPWCVVGCSDGPLGLLNVSGLPNDVYEVELVLLCEGSVHRDVCTFALESDLKLGLLEFSEEDSVLVVGGLRFPLYRRYSSHGGLGDLGYGWRTGLSDVRADLCEEREASESLSGERMSVRTGGRRDLTLDLPDGSRQTFCFSLVPVGGWSYAYRGIWRAGNAGSWELRPTVSDEVTALPGLEPHWQATGLGVPMDMYDFPGFILSGEDGRSYEFAREHLGQYEAVGEDGLGVVLDCWGDLRLSRVSLGGGRELKLSQEGAFLRTAAGGEEELLQIFRGEDGLIREIHCRDDERTELFYTYDAAGNLLEVWKRKREGKRKLIRRYAYEHELFPHLLTAIQNGDGKSLGAYSYDERGSLVSVSNGIGGVVSSERDAFRGIEIRQDENGFETVVSFDGEGRILEEVRPDGGVVSYEYDSRGHVVERLDALGRSTRWTRDAQGRPLERRSPGGAVTSYEYDRSGACCAVTDSLGRRTTRRGSPTWGDADYTFPLGGGLQLRRDSEGRLVSAGLRGSSDIELSLGYSGDGKLVLSDGHGEELEISHEDVNGLQRLTGRWVDPVTGEHHEFVEEHLLDGSGRVLYCADDQGNTLEYERDSSGRVLREERSDGRWRSCRYDAGGRLSEEVDSYGGVRRLVYGSGGLLLLEAGPQSFPCTAGLPDESLLFVRGVVMEHDGCGRVVSRQERRNVRVGVRSLGSGQVECVVEDWGEAVSAEETEYDLAGQVVRTRSPDGRVERLGYDAEGRVSWHEDGQGHRVTLERDLAGRLVKLTDPLGGETVLTYGETGQLVERVEPDGRRCQWVRGPWGEVMVKKRTGEADLRFSRCEDGRVTSVSQGPLTCHVGWNSQDGMESFTDGLGRRVRYERDGLNRLCREETAQGRVRTWGYDDRFGAPAWAADGAGRRQEIRRKNDGNVDSVVWYQAGEMTCEVVHLTDDSRQLRFPDGTSRIESWKRDEHGRRDRYLVDGKTLMKYDHDVLGRLVAWRTEHTSCERSYDENGRAHEQRYTRCGGKPQPEALVMTKRWDGLGRCVEERAGEDWRETGYDCMGRVAVVRQGKGDESLYEGRYGFDQAGRRTSLEEVITVGGQVIGRSHAWAYDELGRLVSEVQRCPERPELTFSWGCRYDLAGNILEECREDVNGRQLTHHEYDRDNCLLRSEIEGTAGSCLICYEWDGSGALVREVCTGGESWERVYEWDFAGRLSSVKQVGSSSRSVDFEYDARGVLCGYHVLGQVGVGVGGRHYILTQSDESSPGLPRVLEVTVCGSEGRASKTCLSGRYPLRLQSDEAETYVYNGHGGVVMRSGELLCSDSWGHSVGSSCWDGPGGFGEWQESTSGLLYMRGRYYSPRLRRFISPDPVSGCFEEPRSFHRYAYCLNDPLNRIDPTGCFSMLSMLSSLGTSLVSMSVCIGFHGLQFLSDVQVMEDVFGELESHEKRLDAVTVWVHGMSWHDRGWSRTMENGLRRFGVSNQDFFEFRWSGFTMFGLDFYYPLRMTHTLSVMSLATVMLEFQLMGYDHINVISHSWGTVLSRDLLRLLAHLNLDLWVTMGSPLGMQPSPPNVSHWLNVYNPYDPVINGSLLLWQLRYNQSQVPLYKQTAGLEQLKIHDISNLHSPYWTNILVLERVSQLLGAR